MVKQKKLNTASLISFESQSGHVLFEIESSAISKELRVHYRHDDVDTTLTSQQDISDSRWHSIIASVSRDSHLTLYVDCKVSLSKQLHSMDLYKKFNSIKKLSKSSSSSSSLLRNVWIGQRNADSMFFKRLTRSLHFKRISWHFDTCFIVLILSRGSTILD
ncbi:hypothetical protein HELRODRAFT_175614 [Helobdella robusta]|uniref:Laminin G domain-containing protein n=1 Tax=Helobdella robusta TaxID=6412 RepID=T1F9F5_HELRO|nr:hypothetical protein HELRODRAFT_175614 [Helobdella robusta]ESO00636.1 hypothetical protein HELRODRAFT_175614 [Helobdella robusta]